MSDSKQSDKQSDKQQLPSVQSGSDPFSAYGAKVGVVGQFLSFKNGEFLYGQNDTELPIGTRLLANMPGLRLGWRRWFSGQVADDRTLLLIDQQPQELRENLGYLDERLWELDAAGKPRDPWVLTNILELADPDGTTYIYTTSSHGGRNAIGRLCKEYGRLYRQRPGQTPIVELGNDFYTHPQYGKTYVPDFRIVGWADEAGQPILEGAPQIAAETPAPTPATKTKTKTAAIPSGARAPKF